MCELGVAYQNKGTIPGARGESSSRESLSGPVKWHWCRAQLARAQRPWFSDNLCQVQSVYVPNNNGFSLWISSDILTLRKQHENP